MNQISPKASLYGKIEMGDNVRIDDFCILTGDIKIGSNIHIACYTFISGQYGVEIEDYVQIAPRVSILSGSDDYSGGSMVGPTIPDEYKPKLETGKVILKKHVLLGLGTVIMPGVMVGEGVSTGAFTFINKDLDPWGMYVGIPARILKERKKKILELTKEFENVSDDFISQV